MQDIKLTMKVADLILQVVDDGEALTRSDLQAVVEVKAREVIALVRAA